jgi:hypothetical protein
MLSGLQHIHNRPNRDPSFVNDLQPMGGGLFLESRRSSGGRWSAGCSLRSSSAGGRLHPPNGDQLAAVSRPIHTPGLGLRSDQGLCADHPRGKFHFDARGRSKLADPFDQGAGQLCQVQSRQAVVRQR